MLSLPRNELDLAGNDLQRLLAELDARVAALQTESLGDPKPVVLRVIDRVRGQVAANSYFTQDVAQDFTALLAKIVKFVARCLDTDRIEDAGVDYLFHDVNTADPLEEQLAYDMRRFLASSEFSRGSFYSEVRAVGHGRVDVLCIFATHRFVAELKKENDDASWDALADQYGAQGAAYQATDVPLGFVVTLDLTRDPQSPPPLLDECFEVRHLRFEGSEEPRTLVFVRVPGRQQRPSAL